MAIAETTEVEEMQPVMVTHIDLLLNQDEADALRTVLSMIGGNPDGTRRGLLDGIREALGEAGAVTDTSDIMQPDDPERPSYLGDKGGRAIYFVNPQSRLWNDGRTA